MVETFISSDHEIDFGPVHEINACFLNAEKT